MADSKERKGRGMQLSIKLMDGKLVPVKVKEGPSASVRWIKDEIKDEIHLLPEMQQLYFQGDLLDDERTASSYSIKDGSILKVIGLRPSTVPLHATQARYLASIMDRATTAKDDSRREARARAMRYHAKKQRDLEDEAALQLAVDMGTRYATADMTMRLRMRTRLLKSGYIEDPTVDADLATVLKQRDYLIQRQAGLLKKNGAMVDGFLDELKDMLDLDQGARGDAATFDAALVREASVVRGRIEPTLTVGADIVRKLRETAAQAEAEKVMAKEESAVLKYEQHLWKKAKKGMEYDIRMLKLQLDTTQEELLHTRRQVRSTAPDYKTVKLMFSQIDEDGSGVLEKHELKALCVQLRSMVPLELSPSEMASAVRRLDRDGDGTVVDFNEFFAWYEQEMTYDKMRDRTMYAEVRTMFQDLDVDGSGELDIGEVKQLAETLLAPVDDASGYPRGFTPTELGDIMTKMDRDGNDAVDFEEFYYWYEQEMEKKAVQVALDVTMAEFEAEAVVRAETIQELQSTLFGKEAEIEQQKKDGEEKIRRVTAEAEAALFSYAEMNNKEINSSDEEGGGGTGAGFSAFFPRTSSLLPSSSIDGDGGEMEERLLGWQEGTRKGWSAVVHGTEIDADAAATSAAITMKKKMALRARQAEQATEIIKVEKKLGKIKKANDHEKELELAAVGE